MKQRLVAYAAILGLVFLGAAQAWAADVTLVPKGSVWKYLDQGSDQGTAWRAPAFNDGAWPSGAAQLGYGDGGEATVVGYGSNAGAKYITTYFRRAFSVSDPTAYRSVTLNLLRDDGAVVYLNGTEVFRSNLPTGAVSYTTLALAAIGGTDESTFYPASIDPSLLVAGTNVLAVEVHQANGTSSDLSFDAELIGSSGVSVTRGPYLQMGTSTSQVLRWRTSAATDSRVRLGASPATLTTTVDVVAATTEHAVTVTGLVPSTVYYYSVGSTTDALAGGDLNHYFVTPPLPGTPEPTRVWVLGDAGTAGPTGINSNQTAVKNAYSAFNGGSYTDLILLLGDNAYENGTDAEYQNAVFDMYASFLRRSNLWSTIGNHDTAQSTNPDVATVPYFNIFTLPAAGQAGGVASGTEKYYSFDFGNIHFVCLDSMTSGRAVNSAMLTWLASDLAANTRPWVIAFWHHPPYTKGSHDSDTETQLKEMRANALPILEAYGVDLVLTGHSHSYERSFLLGGHYGLSTTLAGSMIKDGGSGRPAGTGAYVKATNPYRAVYAVAGSSGKISGGALNHPAMFISLNELGSMVIDVNGSRLDATFLRDDGAIADSFSIVKAAGNVAPTVSITSPTNGASYTAPANISITAGASDTDGTISKVELFNGATLVGTRSSPPYDFAWNNVAAGSYALTAKATDNAGAVTTSSAVNVTVVSTAPAAPAAPTGLTATAVSGTRIDLAWSDNSTNETGFRVERSTNGSSFTQIATTGADGNSYSSTGLAKNKTYYYRVRATNAGGSSAYSNTASAKTLRR
jgi:hypothetical protein